MTGSLAAIAAACLAVSGCTPGAAGNTAYTWNDYFLALVLVSDPAHQPITPGLGAFSGRYLIQLNLLSAAAILVSLPIIVLSFVF